MRLTYKWQSTVRHHADLEPGGLASQCFFIDPKILEDKSTNYIDSIVLSYTFFYSNNNFEKVSQYKY